MELFKLLLITVASCSCLSSVDSKILCISIEENTCMNCTSSCDKNTTMQNLMYHLENASDSEEISIILHSTRLPLDRQISIRDKPSLLIESPNSTIIVCSERNSGFEFINTTNITLQNFHLKNCGVKHSQDVEISQSSMLFLNSSNVRVYNVNITNGTGLSVVDTRGIVHIENCTFENNNSSRGGGLLIEFTSGELTGFSSHYTITGCVFKHNNASTESTSDSRTSESGFGRGGGLNILIKGSSQNNNIDVINCTFYNNSAVLGGGLYIAIQSSADNNNISINETIFMDNRGLKEGGAGKIGFSYLGTNDTARKWNQIDFNNCSMTQNSAHVGGAISVHSNPNYDPSSAPTLQINFNSCCWSKNRAEFGAAVNMATEVCGRLKRENVVMTLYNSCSFQSNIISGNPNLDGKGTFRAVEMDVKFAGSLDFSSNNDTALFIQSSNATFLPDSRVCFKYNEGRLGGAISVVGLSYLEINDNSTFTFISNTARERGGAIYQSLYGTDLQTSCFIQYIGENNNVAERMISFTFQDNKAGSGEVQDEITSAGDSMHVSTLYPCHDRCKQHTELCKTFDCIGYFTFGKDVRNEISTAGKELDLLRSTANIMPGGWLQLPILRDELNNQVTAIYHISMPYNQTNIWLANEYTTDKQVKVYGSSGSNTTLWIETIDVWEIAVSINVHMTECPPGYTLRQEGKVTSCECTATSNKELYTGIVNCTEPDRVQLRVGYWLGYNITEGYGRESELKSGYCPLSNCVYNGSALTLPNSTDVAELDRIVCGSRTGRLCAYCRGNLTSYYHTSTYECRSSEKCHIGWLLFLVSEILPITLFFLVIIVFDVNFTDGAVNGLIFHFQISYIFIYVTSGFVRCSAANLLNAYNFIIGIFNLKFFYHKSLAFCLWEGAQSLDLVAFRYVKIIYSLMLVLVVIGILRICNVRKATQKLPKVCGREIGTQSSMIHGLSGFLVLCYSECTKVSILLLIPIVVYGKNDEKTTVPLFNGDHEYFQGKHLAYALPALTFLVFFGLGPPLLLLSYPLCYRVFDLLKIGESKFVKILCILIPLERFKPFFDSLQSSFKDEYRFCSGLYFLYRLLAVLALLITPDVTNYFTLITIGFSFVLCFHAIAQPYKKRWHNILDGYIFTSKIILCILTLYNYRRALENRYESISVVCIIIALVLWIPLVYFIVWLLKMFFMNMMQKLRAKRHKKGENICKQELLESFLSERRDSWSEAQAL